MGSFQFLSAPPSPKDDTNPSPPILVSILEEKSPKGSYFGGTFEKQNIKSFQILAAPLKKKSESP